VRGEKFLGRLASGFAFLLANPEFHSHLASWQVVISTPAVKKSQIALAGWVKIEN
jgi:hypothetical protein